MGASLGGTRAVQSLLAELRMPLRKPLAIALHRHRDSSAGLIEFLQCESCIPVAEASDKQRIDPGIAYVAPPDYHLLIDGDRFALSIDEPVSYARPSIDVLFESAAATFGRETIAVVLTGGGADGARGAVAVEAAGGVVLAQDPDEAVASSMPAATIAATKHAEVLPLGALAERLMQLAK